MTRQALDRLRALSRQRETYVEEWLPESLLTSPDVAEDVELAEAVGKAPADVRQIAHRARERMAARRPRMQVSRAEQQAAVESFRAATQIGDLQGLLDVLAPDGVMVADGGGLAPPVLHPVEGAEQVARVLTGFARTAPGTRLEAMWLNAPLLSGSSSTASWTPRSALPSTTAGSPASTRSGTRTNWAGSGKRGNCAGPTDVRPTSLSIAPRECLTAPGPRAG